MDRNREARRGGMVTTTSNGGALSRRRHRSSTTLRDSTDEDGGVELQESIRLRERVKKERDLRERDRDRERDRERERERERATRNSSKRRRAERLLIHNNQNNNNNNNTQFNNNHRSLDAGLVDDSSEESVNDDEDEEYEDTHHHTNSLHHSNSGGGLRSSPPAGVAAGGVSNQPPPLQHRKSFPPSGSNTANVKSFRTAPVWKSGDEMIGVSVPRKARSAATKRGHDWMTCYSGGGGGGEQPSHQPVSTSPARQSVVPASSLSPAAPVSPSSSNASTRKKLKPSNGNKQRPPKSSSVAKSSSSNPEELEIEIAEVLYGLMNHPQGPSSRKEISSTDSKEANNRSNNDSKSRISSPITGSSTGPPLSILPQNSTSVATPFSAVAPKRKRPRQVPDNLASPSGLSSPFSSSKAEMNQASKTEVSNSNSSPCLTPGSAADLASLAPELVNMDSERKPMADEVVDTKEILAEKEEVGCSMKRDSPNVRPDESICEDAFASSSAVAGGVETCVDSVCKASVNVVEVERYREDKFKIDLMAPPPQSRMSPEREGDVHLEVEDQKPNLLNADVKNTVALMDQEADKMERSGKGEMLNIGAESKISRTDGELVEGKNAVEDKSPKISLQLDLERSGEVCVAGIQKQQQETVTKATPKVESNDEKPGVSSSLSIPMSMPSWPGGLPPMGYMAPLQGVVSVDGAAVPPVPIQMPMFSQPRPKRCETHCYIARNIHYMQQFMKMNPFWSAAAAASSASLFGSKAASLSVMPSADLHGNMPARVVNHGQDNKGQGLAVPPGHGGKDKGSPHLNSSDSAQRNQPILLQQAMPPVTHNNMLGPTFIFPLHQQQAAVAAAAAAVRPGSAKSPAITPGASSNAANTSAVSSLATGALPAMSYNYPNMAGNETQYLAILQNNGYPFPIPTVGANPNFRGPHPQPLPLFNGFSYSSQMIHPSQLQQQALPSSPSQQVLQSHPSALWTSSSSTLKHMQSQHISQGNAFNGVSGNGNSQQAAAKNLPPQQNQSSTNQHPQVSQMRQLESQMGEGDGPDMADTRGTRAGINMYGQNFAMPMHIPNFALIPPPATMGGASSASSNQGDRKHQHQSQQPGTKTGIEPVPVQTFAMSFGPLNGATNPGFELSSMAQNHAIFQNFTEASRHNFKMMAAANAGGAAHHKKEGRASEDSKTGGSDPSDGADDERKGLASKIQTTSGQSIAFSRTELLDGTTIQGNHVVESSARGVNQASASARSSHSSMPNPMASSGVQNAQLQAQLQHQQQHLIQLHKQQQQQQQQQQQLTGRSKTPVTSNGNSYRDHLAASTSIAAAKFPNVVPFSQNLVQNNNSNGPSQSPQWKNPPRTSTSQNPSSYSSSTPATLKNMPQQPARAVQNLNQISFGSNQKSSAGSHRKPPSSNQASSPPMVVGSPTTSSISKGASGSPRITNTTATSNKTSTAPSMPTQQSKSSPSGPNQKSSPSTASGKNISSNLGNTQGASTTASGTKSQMQLHAQQQQQQQQQQIKNMQQAQLFFSSPYMQNQSLHAPNTNAPGNTGYYLQKRRLDQQHSPQQPPGSYAPSSTGILSLSSVGTMDPAKAIAAAAAAATAASNMKGGGLQPQSIPNASQLTEHSSGNHHHLMSGGFSYGHAVPASVQMKPAEHKQPAGSDNLHESWQPEKK